MKTGAPPLPRAKGVPPMRWKFHGEEPSHFTVSKGEGKPFKVAKKGLSASLVRTWRRSEPTSAPMAPRVSISSGRRPKRAGS